MDPSPLSTEQLTTILSSNPPSAELFSLLSEYEDEACLLFTAQGVSGDPELLSLYYSAFFISHLLIDEISEARMLTTRMPPTLLEEDVALQNCLNLLRAVWQPNHDQVYKVLRNLPWPESLAILVRRYEEFFREKTLREISRGYEAIRPQAAAVYLGLDLTRADKGDTAVIEALTSCGWTWDQDTKLLYPKPILAALPSSARRVNGLTDVTALMGKYGS